MSNPAKARADLRHDADQFSLELQRAQTRQEALDVAIQAAENALKSLSVAQDADEKSEYRTRAKNLLKGAEDVKNAADWRQAASFMATILPSSSPSPGSDDSAVAANVGHPVKSRPKALKEPQSTRILTTREKIILARATFLNGAKFPAWESAPPPEEFQIGADGVLFTDESSELPLSDFQLDVLDDWKRPAEALPPPSWYSSGAHIPAPSMDYLRDMDLVQDAATDCSVVASLCAGSARANKGHARMLKTIMYPWDHEKDRPSLSANGKYIFRLNFNGCFRRVTIDDRIPTSATSRVIHILDRNNPALLWPALFEKAYLKVRGGYDFPGSNSGTDLWILTGWVPEQVFLQADDLEPDRFWRRISNAFSFGDVMITMGTGKMSAKTEKALGLAGQHDYAVLDLREVGGQHLMLIKNPWVDGMAWSGRRSSVLVGDPDPVSSPRDLLNIDEQLKPGTFWMDLDNVVQYFESIYLNWNPGLFSYRQDIHFEWDLSETADGNKKPRGPFASLQRNRQFAITAQQTGTVWLLLSRHFHNSVPETATAEEIESGRHFIDLNGHITLATFESIGRRVMLAERHLHKGLFVDSPQTLLKMEECAANRPYTIVPLEQNLPSTKHTFTLSTFSNSPLTLVDAAPRFPHSTLLSAEWTPDTAGGKAETPSHFSNPQFALSVTRKTDISLLLETSAVKLNVHVRLLHSNSNSRKSNGHAGSRVHRMRNRDIIVDSKAYRPGACLAEFDGLDPGVYTIICSTFEAHQYAPFDLLVESSQPTQLQLLPREGAGRVRCSIAPVTFRVGVNRVAACLRPRRMVNLYAVVRPSEAKNLATNLPSATTLPSSTTPAPPSSGQSTPPCSHLRLSVHAGRAATGPEGLSGTALTSSHDGEYADGRYAIRTEEVDLRAVVDRRREAVHAQSQGQDGDGYWLVLERMYVRPEAQREERFEVEVLMDQVDALEVGQWEGLED